MNIQKPNFTVLYNNKNITADISKYMLSLTYNDKTEGESDEIEIQVEDVDLRWQNSWYPEKGAKLTVSIENLKCGVFEIDEIQLSGPPDVVTIRGMATGIVNSLRTKKSDAHESKTLKQIAEKVASKNGLKIIDSTEKINVISDKSYNYDNEIRTLLLIYSNLKSVIGKNDDFTKSILNASKDPLTRISNSLIKKNKADIGKYILSNYPNLFILLKQKNYAEITKFNEKLRFFANELQKKDSKNTTTNVTSALDITFNRITQNKETDLAFLKRISQEYGVLFAVRENVITFTSIYDVEKRNISFSVDKTDISRWDLKDKADGMIKTASVKSKNSKKNEPIAANLDFEKYKSEQGYSSDTPVNQDEGVTHTKAENKQQAEAKAKAIMHLSAGNQMEGNIEMQGTVLAIAGNNFQLTGLGKLSGKYHIKNSSHKIDKSSGYTVGLEIKRLNLPAKSERITKRKSKQQSNNVAVRNIKFPDNKYPYGNPTKIQ